MLHAVAVPHETAAQSNQALNNQAGAAQAAEHVLHPIPLTRSLSSFALSGTALRISLNAPKSASAHAAKPTLMVSPRIRDA